jgi:hypothetical protein
LIYFAWMLGVKIEDIPENISKDIKEE